MLTRPAETRNRRFNKLRDLYRTKALRTVVSIQNSEEMQVHHKIKTADNFVQSEPRKRNISEEVPQYLKTNLDR